MNREAARINKNGNSLIFQINLHFTKLYYPEKKSGNKDIYYGAEHNERNVREANASLCLLIDDLENNKFDKNNELKYKHKSKQFKLQEKEELICLNELLEGYYKEILRRKLTSSTIVKYKMIIKFFNQCPQDIFKYKDIISYIKNSDRGVTTIKKAYEFLVKAFEWGVHEGKISKDILEIEKLIKFEKDNFLNSQLKKARRAKPFFHSSQQNNFASNDKDNYTQEELEIIITRVKEKYCQLATDRKGTNTSIPNIIEFIARTGVRISEAIALTWGDIDFDKQEISINKSFCIISKKTKCTKTGKSRIFPFKGYNKLNNFLERIKPDKIDKNEIIFRNTLGGYLNRYYLSSIWSGSFRVGKENPGLIRELIDEGLIDYHIPLYNLRHSFITIQLMKTKDPLMVSKWTGHDVQTLLSNYAKLKGTESSPMD